MTWPVKELWVRLPEQSRRAGADVVVYVRELPIGEFARGVPDVIPHEATECFAALDPDGRYAARVGWQRWVDEMLSRVVVVPRLTPAQITLLGPDRDDLAQRCLRDFGVLGRERLYEKNFLAMVQKLAKFSRRFPSEILQLSTSEFWFNWTVLFGPKADDEEMGASLGRTPVSDLEFDAPINMGAMIRG